MDVTNYEAAAGGLCRGFEPDPDGRRVRDLATLGFVKAQSNIALLGPPGVGKTMLAVALAVAACQAGYSVYFTSHGLPHPQTPDRRTHRTVQPAN